MISKLSSKILKDTVPQPSSGLNSVTSSGAKTLHYSIGSVVKGADRRCSLEPHLGTASFANGADAVPSEISDFTLAQNRGGLKLPNLQYYHYVRSLVRFLKLFVWQDLISMSYDVFFPKAVK